MSVPGSFPRPSLSLLGADAAIAFLAQMWEAKAVRWVLSTISWYPLNNNVHVGLMPTITEQLRLVARTSSMLTTWRKVLLWEGSLSTPRSLFLVFERVQLLSPGCPGNTVLDQAALELTYHLSLLLSAGILKAYVTMPSPHYGFCCIYDFSLETRKWK